MDRLKRDRLDMQLGRGIPAEQQLEEFDAAYKKDMPAVGTEEDILRQRRHDALTQLIQEGMGVKAVGGPRGKASNLAGQLGMADEDVSYENESANPGDASLPSAEEYMAKKKRLEDEERAQLKKDPNYFMKKGPF